MLEIHAALYIQRKVSRHIISIGDFKLLRDYVNLLLLSGLQEDYKESGVAKMHILIFTYLSGTLLAVFETSVKIDKLTNVVGSRPVYCKHICVVSHTDPNPTSKRM